MQQANYELPVGSEGARRIAAAWLALGLISLVFAGIFSLLLVLARTPVVQGWIPFIDFFHISLVVHVTLSVLVWLLAISATISANCSEYACNASSTRSCSAISRSRAIFFSWRYRR